MVSDNGIGTFQVTLLPNVVIVKSVQVVTDPYNGGTNPKAIPGATMLYDVTVTNQGIGTADAVTVAVVDHEAGIFGHRRQARHSRVVPGLEEGVLGKGASGFLRFRHGRQIGEEP